MTGNSVTCGGTGTALHVEEALGGSTIVGNTLLNATSGVVLDDAWPEFIGNTIEGHAIPMVFEDDADADLAGNNYNSNDTAVLMHRGTMIFNHQWSELLGGTFRHCIDSELSVGAGATLTIDPGVVVKIDGTRILAYGAIDAVGTELEPIVFTSDRDDDIDGHDTNGDGSATVADAGDWGYLYLHGAGSHLEHCLIRYGGSYSGSAPVVRILNRATVFDNNTVEYIRDHDRGAINCENTAISLHGNIVRHAHYGIRVEYSPSYPDTITISDNEITVESRYGIVYSGNAANSVVHVTGNSVTCGGTSTALHVVDAGPGSMLAANLINDVGVGIEVREASLTCIGNTLSQGETSEQTGVGIKVGNECDVLIDGIVVTGFARGVEALTTSGAIPSSVAIVGNLILDNADEGIYLASSNINVVDGPNVVINGNDIHGNGLFNLYAGAYRYPTERTLDATSNWWGTTDTGVIEALIHDLSDDDPETPVSPTVLYAPVLNEPTGSLEGAIWATPIELSLELFPGVQTVRSLTVGNRGTGTVIYSLHEGVDAPERSDVPWLSIHPSDGDVNPGETDVATVTIDIDGLTEDRYRAHILLQSDDPVNDLIVVPVYLEVSEIFLAGPVPGDTLMTFQTVELDWSVNRPGEIESIDLRLSVDGGQSFPHVIAEGIPNSVPYLWQLSDQVGDSCLVRVDVHYLDGSSASDQTEPYFVIITPPTGNDDGPTTPSRTALLQNAPNPFNPTTRIAFELPADLRVTLAVHDVAGRRVDVLIADQAFSAGRHAIQWRGTDRSGRPLPSGVYFYRLQTEQEVLSRRMVLLK